MARETFSQLQNSIITFPLSNPDSYNEKDNFLATQISLFSTHSPSKALNQFEHRNYHTINPQIQIFLMSFSGNSFISSLKSKKHQQLSPQFPLPFIQHILIPEWAILQILIIIIKKVMLTRKGPEIVTRKQPAKKMMRRVKLIEKMITKTAIRNLVKNQLRKRTSTIRRVSKSASVERMHELIDHSKCECPICLEIAINPVVIQCGHVHCLKCFEEYSIFNLRCCLCRLETHPNQVQSAILVESIIKRFILPTTQEEINYWCRKGEFQEWESKRRIDMKVLRVGDNIDVRTEDNMWRRGVIVCFKYEEEEYCVEVKVCIQAEIKQIVIPVGYRGLASYGFFTKGHYQKYRTTSYQSKFVESIEIPEIHCDFVDESPMMEAREQCSKQREEINGSDLALELFEYQMKEWENVFELS